MHAVRSGSPALAMRQRGAALIVGLILLMVLTVLAVSTMRTATLELLMAGNAQFRENAFQLAETAVVEVMTRIDDGTLALVAADGWRADGPAGVIDGVGRFETEIEYLGEGPLPEGASAGKINCQLFRVEARGFSDRGARADIAQGLCEPAGS